MAFGNETSATLIAHAVQRPPPQHISCIAVGVGFLLFMIGFITAIKDLSTYKALNNASTILVML